MRTVICIVTVALAAGCYSTPGLPADAVIADTRPDGGPAICGVLHDEESAVVAAEDSPIKGAVFERVCSDAETGQLQHDICNQSANACSCWAFEVDGASGRFTGSAGHYQTTSGIECPPCLRASDPIWCSFH